MLRNDDFIASLGPLALGSRFRRLSDALSGQVEQIYREKKLRFEPRWGPLFLLVTERGSVGVYEASELLRLSHVAVLRSAREMADERLIAMARDPEDARKTLLSLTAEGRTMLRRLRPVWNEMDRSVRELLGAQSELLLSALATFEKSHDECSLKDRVCGGGKLGRGNKRSEKGGRAKR